MWPTKNGTKPDSVFFDWFSPKTNPLVVATRPNCLEKHTAISPKLWMLESGQNSCYTDRHRHTPRHTYRHTHRHTHRCRSYQQTWQIPSFQVMIYVSRCTLQWSCVTRVKDGGDWQGSLAEQLGEDAHRRLTGELSLSPGDLLMLTAGETTSSVSLPLPVFFCPLLPLAVATAGSPSPFCSLLRVFLRHFHRCRVLSHRIHKPPFRPSPFPLSWQLHRQPPSPNIPSRPASFLGTSPNHLSLASRTFSPNRPTCAVPLTGCCSKEKMIITMSYKL